MSSVWNRGVDPFETSKYIFLIPSICINLKILFSFVLFPISIFFPEISYIVNADLQYNALSFIFVQVRELSWLQWHPFSVSSSPLEGGRHISVLIKVLGEWTDKLRNAILEKTQEDLKIKSQRLTASVEGPYGHESPYHLT